jgi:hypothetical protein
MSPQPLSRFRRVKVVAIDADALLQRPELAIYPMSIIGRWARIDTRLAQLLSTLLHSPDLAVAMAMFQAQQAATPGRQR